MNVGRGAMDAEVPLTKGTEAYGKDVWSRRPDAGVKLANIAHRPMGRLRASDGDNEPGPTGEITL